MNPLFVFGSKSVDLESLKRDYAKLNFISLKQIHSDLIFSGTEASSLELEGDALWTDKPGEALCIRTADCVPILFFADDDNRPLVAAAHAGWRGIASNIVGKTMQRLIDHGAEASRITAWIGPHIRVESFEVGVDVANQLEAAYSSLPSQGTIVMPHADPAKRYVHLERIAIAQLVAAGINDSNIHLDGTDTLTNFAYHSFRRDGAKAGRQTSFITL